MSAKAAADPATPPAQLAVLARKHPAEVLHNPVLPLLLLENPYWFRQMLELPAHLLKVAELPPALAPALLDAALASPIALVRLQLAQHPAAPPAAVARLLHDPVELVREAARHRVGSPPPLDPDLALRDALLLGLPPYVAVDAPYHEEILTALAQLPGAVPLARLAWLQQPISTALQASQPGLAATPPGKPFRSHSRFHPPFESLYLAGVQAHPNLTLGQRLHWLRPLLLAPRGTRRPPRPATTGIQDLDLLGSVLPHLRHLPGAVPAASAEELATAATQPDWLSQAAAAGHPDTPPAIRRQLLTPAAHPLVWQAAGATPGAPADELRQLYHAPGRSTPSAARRAALHLGLATNPATPADVLQLLTEAPAQETDEQDFSLMHALAANPGTGPAQLAQLLQLAFDRDESGQRYHPATLLRAAANPATPPALLLWLFVHFCPDWVTPAADAATKYPLPPLRHWLPALPLGKAPDIRNHRPRTPLPPPAELRALLAASPVLPPELRALLAAYPHPLPALADNWPGLETLPAVLAAHPAAPPALLTLLAALPDRDPNLTRRQALAANPAAPVPVLLALAGGRSLEVARAALRHPAFPPPVPADNTETARRWRARQLAAPALGALATDKASAVRTLVAENPATPPPLLAQLATDHIGAVRMAVAAHSATPGAVLQQLAQDADTLVVRAVAAHPATPGALVTELARHPNKFVRRAALASPQLPAEVLPKLVKEKSLENRLLLLLRPEGRRALLRQLASHSPEATALVHLLLPEELTAAHHAALAASPIPGHRLAVAGQSDLAPQLRDDRHLLVRLVAQHTIALPSPTV